MSIFDSATLGTANNQIVFNSFTTFPVYRVLSERPQQRQIRDLDLPIPFESGISDFETLIGKTAYVIEGKMYPSSEADWSTGLAALRKLANLDYEQADSSSDSGYVPYVFSENGSSRQLFLKVLYVNAGKDTRQGLITPFQLICKVKDPTIYGYPSKTASTQGTNPTTLGGTAVFSVALPIIFGASTVTVSNTANNAGTIPVYPSSIIVNGPINTPTVTNTTTGEYITINQNLSSISDVLTISYDKDSLSITLNGNSVLSSVVTGSTYFKLRPGNNTITLSGSTISSGAYCVVNYLDGWALS
jgi:hypothetical protein